MILKARRKISYYILTALCTLCILPFFLMSIFFTMEVVRKILSEEILDKNDYITIGMAIFFFLLSTFVIVMLIMNIPKKISIDTDNSKIYVGNNSYRLSEIKEVLLTGKIPARLTPYKEIGISLTFVDGKTEYFATGNYSDLSRIKFFLQKVIIEKGRFEDFYLTKDSVPSRIYNENGKTYKKDSFFGFWDKLTIVGIFFTLYTYTTSNITLQAYSSIIVSGLTLSTLLNIFPSNYVILTKEYLIIKHQFFNRKRIVYLTEIREIVFELGGGKSVIHTIRIVNHDFSEKIYTAESLDDRNWSELEKDLKTINIAVRNEII